MSVAPASPTMACSSCCWRLPTVTRCTAALGCRACASCGWARRQMRRQWQSLRSSGCPPLAARSRCSAPTAQHWSCARCCATAGPALCTRLQNRSQRCRRTGVHAPPATRPTFQQSRGTRFCACAPGVLQHAALHSPCEHTALAVLRSTLQLQYLMSTHRCQPVAPPPAQPYMQTPLLVNCMSHAQQM